MLDEGTFLENLHTYTPGHIDEKNNKTQSVEMGSNKWVAIIY